MSESDVHCRRPGCGDPYREHAPGGGHCRVHGCDCPGMRWVDVDGPAVGSYSQPPARA